MRKLCDVDEVRKCLDDAPWRDDAVYAKGLLEWAMGKRTIDEADIRADECKKVLDEFAAIFREKLQGTMDAHLTDDGRLEFSDHLIGAPDYLDVCKLMDETINMLKGEQE